MQEIRRKWGYFFGLRLIKKFFVAALILRITFVQGRSKEYEENSNSSYRDGYNGHGTTHEQMGQVHWPLPEYTPYTPQRNYSKDSRSPSTALYPIYNFSHFIFHSGFTDDPILPPGECN